MIDASVMRQKDLEQRARIKREGSGPVKRKRISLTIRGISPGLITSRRTFVCNGPLGYCEVVG
jgi:hypothetical protein